MHSSQDAYSVYSFMKACISRMRTGVIRIPKMRISGFKKKQKKNLTCVIRIPQMRIPVLKKNKKLTCASPPEGGYTYSICVFKGLKATSYEWVLWELVFRMGYLGPSGQHILPKLYLQLSYLSCKRIANQTILSTVFPIQTPRKQQSRETMKVIINIQLAFVNYNSR